MVGRRESPNEGRAAETNLAPSRYVVMRISAQLGGTIWLVGGNCAGMPIGLITSSAAPVWDWLRMRQAIERPSNSMLPAFKRLLPC